MVFQFIAQPWPPMSNVYFYFYSSVAHLLLQIAPFLPKFKVAIASLMTVTEYKIVLMSVINWVIS